jgi:hypothetical protein
MTRQLKLIPLNLAMNQMPGRQTQLITQKIRWMKMSPNIQAGQTLELQALATHQNQAKQQTQCRHAQAVKSAGIASGKDQLQI